MDGYEAGIYMVDSYEWSIILDIMLTLCINCGIMLVKVDNETCYSPMLEATCSIKCLTPYALVPEVIEMGSMRDIHESRAKQVLVEFEPFT